MSMHLCHPSITLNGKKKTKQKYRDSKSAKTARELQNSWDQYQKEWLKLSKNTKTNLNITKYTTDNSVYTRSTVKIPSLNSWVTGVVSSKESTQYTGDQIIGISTLHKSNSIPVFNKESIIDIAKMRRG